MKKSIRLIDIDDRGFILDWPFSDAGLLVPALKDFCPLREYSRGETVWIIPAEAQAVGRLQEFGEKFDFDITDEAETRLNSILNDLTSVSADGVSYPDRRIYIGPDKNGRAAFLIKTKDVVPAVYQVVSRHEKSHYVKGSGAWALPFSEAAKVQEIARKFKFTVTGATWARIQSEQEAINREAEIEQKKRAALKSAALSLVHQSFEGKTPRKYQLQGIAKMLGAEFGCYLADDMGLGKTFQALLLGRCYQLAFSAQIVVISQACYIEGWQREANACGIRARVYSWAKVPDPPTSGAPFVLLVDEAQMMQNATAERTKRVLALSKSNLCLKAVPMSGTPMQGGRPVNFFTALQLIRHQLGNDWKYYRDTFCGATLEGFGKEKHWNVKGYSNTNRLMKEVAEVFIRRTKEEVADELPARTIVQKSVEIDNDAKLAYWRKFNAARDLYESRRIDKIEQVAVELGLEYDKAAKVVGSQEIVLLGILRHAASIAKVNAVKDLADEILEQGRPVVIFTGFLESARTLAAKFQADGVQTELLTGGAKDRQAMQDRFQAGDSRVWVSTLMAGNTSLTLHAASDVIIADPWWIWDALAQAIDRTHRIGQKRAVMAYMIEGFEIDTRIYNQLAEQRKILAQILTGTLNESTGGTIKSANAMAKQIAGEMFARAA